MRLQSCTTAVKHSYIAMYVVTNIICINRIRLNKAKHTKRPSDYATLTTSQRSPNTCIKQLKRERNRPRIDDSSIYVITRMSFRMVDSGHESGTNQADAASGPEGRMRQNGNEDCTCSHYQLYSFGSLIKARARLGLCCLVISTVRDHLVTD